MGAEEKLAKIKLLLDEGCIYKDCTKCSYGDLYSGCTELYLLDAIEELVNADESST